MVEIDKSITSILIIGKGLVGDSLLKVFKKNGFIVRATSRKELNLLDYFESLKFFKSVKPETIIIFAAGVSGGIEENLRDKFRLYSENSLMLSNLLYLAHKCNLKYLINIVPACVYPAKLNSPALISDLFTSPMESTSLYYSTAKLAGFVGVTSLQDQNDFNWVNLISSNVYGDYDSARKLDTHVIPQLIRKFMHAKMNKLEEIQLLGNGDAVRDFIYSEDLADAISFFVEKNLWKLNNFNISGGNPIKINSLAESISNLIGYRGRIKLSDSKLNGTSYKVLDDTEFRNFGWRPKVPLLEGLRRVIASMS